MTSSQLAYSDICYLSAHIIHKPSQHTADYHFEIIFTTSVEMVNDGPDLNWG